MSVADSPVMQQYQRLKAQHADALVMFRMGDFYELFGDDAIVASEILQITLTKRRTAKEGDAGVAMCGVPFHAAEGYIGKLLAHHKKVALVEQVETPDEAKKARGSAALVRREVVRVFTPATLTEESFLEGKTAVLLVSVWGGFGDGLGGAKETVVERWEGALAWLDVSTGEVGVRPVTGLGLASVLAGLPVGEVLVAGEVPPALLGQLPRRLVSVQEGLFAEESAAAAVRRAYGLEDVRGLGLPDAAALRAVGALVGYAELTQMGRMPPLRRPSVVLGRGRLQIDANTRRNLELTESTAGKRADSLLGVLDRSVTSAGARLLARWVAEPLAILGEIEARQAAVAVLVQDGARRGRVRELLQHTGDIARCVSRLLLGRGGPRDLAVLRGSGAVLPALHEALGECGGLLALQAAPLVGLGELTKLLMAALADDPLPALVREGGFIRGGFDAELDAARRLQHEGQDLLVALEKREAAASGIGVKVRYNQVWGYYVEATKAQLEGRVIPAHFVHRQTTTNSQRFSTAELMALERDLASAGLRAQQREEAILAELVAAIKANSYALLAVSEALATLDALATLAEVAVRFGWVRPELREGLEFEIVGGKHPVVAAKIADFVANDCDLSGGAFWLLTGPNMAGKSTFLRQNALIVVLAQVGSFVPAVRAVLGLADAIFSRIGAADDLAAGQSTFMVEMVETAQILNRASSRSLVILDELGRGTATYDGLAIAWACVEDIVQRLGCRTLFATHYHELTALAEKLPKLACHQLAVKEWQGEMVFLHQVLPGAAAGSFGVQVAKLAGVPPPVVRRAGELLEGFLKVARGRGVMRVDELSLFSAPVAAPVAQTESEIERRLRSVDVDGLSAREALAFLQALRTEMDDGKLH